MEVSDAAGLGRGQKPSLWLGAAKGKPLPLHIAFAADNRSQVDEFYGRGARQAKTRRERIARDNRFRKRRADLRMPCQKGSSRGIRMGVRGSRSRSLQRAWKQDRPTLCRPTLGIH